MALHLISEPQYKIDRLEYEGHIFTASSPNRLSTPQATAFASQKENFVLQSLPDAVAFRLEANGADNADKYQKTRSTAAFFTRNGTPYVAIDHVYEPWLNLVSLNAQKGYDANLAGNELLVSLREKRLKSLLSRAEKNGNIFSFSGNLELALEGEYAGNSLVQALFGGTELASDYALFLQGKNFSTGNVWFPTSDYVGNKVSDNKNAIIRPVGLGGDDFGYIYGVYAYVVFGGGGFA